MKGKSAMGTAALPLRQTSQGLRCVFLAFLSSLPAFRGEEPQDGVAAGRRRTGNLFQEPEPFCCSSAVAAFLKDLGQRSL